MATGTAQEDIQYERLARGIVQTLRSTVDGRLVGFRGEGIRVPIEAGGTTWNFDVALRRENEDVPCLLGECRRWAKVQEQEQIAAFAWRVRLVRQKYNCDIEAIYFTKTGFQDGSKGAAEHAGVKLVVVNDVDQTPLDFELYWHRRGADPQKHVGRSISMSVVASVHAVGYAHKSDE